MEDRIFKDANGNEFILRQDTIGENNRKVFVGKNPVLNPEGKQVKDPIRAFQFIDNTIDTVNESCNSKYPYYVFGSEFCGAEIQALPSPYSNNIDAIDSTLQASSSFNSFMQNKYNKEIDIVYDSRRIEIIAKTLYDELVKVITQNIVNLYNNNLRIILQSYLFNKDDFYHLDILSNQIHALNIHDGYTVLYPGLPGFVNVNEEGFVTGPKSDLECLNISTVMISEFNAAISKLYANLIIKVTNMNLVNVSKLAEDKLGDSIPLSYAYSAGVDLLNEIANMECGVLSDMVEVNVMRTISTFLHMTSPKTSLPNKSDQK